MPYHSQLVLLPCHHVVKLFLRDLSVLVEICPVDHLLEFGLVDILPHVAYHLLQSLQSDISYSFLVE